MKKLTIRLIRQQCAEDELKFNLNDDQDPVRSEGFLFFIDSSGAQYGINLSQVEAFKQYTIDANTGN